MVRRVLLWMCLVVCCMGAGPSLVAAQVESGEGYVGQPLAKVLVDFRHRGLDIFFTSQVVTPDMRVEAAPESTELRKSLDQILEPHGLAVIDGPGGRLVVVVAVPSTTGIRGFVLSRYTGVPVAGVRIVLPDADLEDVSDGDGAFEISGLDPGLHRLEAHLPGFVVDHRQVRVTANQLAEVEVALEPAPLALDEIVITPSRISLLSREAAGGFDLDREDIFALPHLGDDIFRAFTLLPGISGEESSARFNVRGGRDDEVLVLLDRVELYEPYHLKDFSSFVSIVTPRALREVNLMTGGFSARYGDRMSGVLDMTTLEPDERNAHIGVGVLNTELAGSGRFHNSDGDWLASIRRSNLRYVLDVVGIREQPEYWDAFAKINHSLGPNQNLGIHALHSNDSLKFLSIEPDTIEDYRTSYGNSYLWMTHQALLSDRLYVDTTGFVGRVKRDRRGNEVELEEPDDEDAGDGSGDAGDEGGDGEEGQDSDGDQDEVPELPEGFDIFDRRRLEVGGIKQDWNYQPSDRHELNWGIQARQLTTDYDYLNSLRPKHDPLAGIRKEPRQPITQLRRELSGEQYSAYFSDRTRLSDRWVMELGLRWDEHTSTSEGDLSPRINLLWSGGRFGNWRAAWGYFYQSQRPYELQVEDGITELAPAERTEQRVIGFERSFDIRAQKDLEVRIEAYQRFVTNPRARFENIYEPLSVFPEIEADRIRINPDNSRAYGIELFLRGAIGEVGWWIGYSYARTFDRIDGREVPRRIDQPHAFSFDLDFALGKHWHLNLAWRYHTGWPTTEVFGVLMENEDGELEPVPVFGPLNAERLPDYHRLDIRASREWQRKRGVLGFYLEVQNVYDRENLAGFDTDFEFEEGETGRVELIPLPEVWGGVLPSFGITWDF